MGLNLAKRPEFAKALELAHEFRQAAPHQPVILTVHELKRPARNGAELMALASDLQAAGIQLELLTGPLSGIYDPNGVGSMLFAALANAAQLDRNYIRENTLEGQQAAAAKGNHGPSRPARTQVNTPRSPRCTGRWLTPRTHRPHRWIRWWRYGSSPPRSGGRVNHSPRPNSTSADA